MKKERERERKREREGGRNRGEKKDRENRNAPGGGGLGRQATGRGQTVTPTMMPGDVCQWDSQQHNHKGQREPETFTQWLADNERPRAPTQSSRCRSRRGVGCLSKGAGTPRQADGRWGCPSSTRPLDWLWVFPNTVLARIWPESEKICMRSRGRLVVWGQERGFPTCSLKLWLAQGTLFK